MCGAPGFCDFSHVLLAGNFVIMFQQYRLDKAGEKFHIEVEEIYCEGHCEKCEAYKQQLFKELAEFGHFYLLSFFDSSLFTTTLHHGGLQGSDRQAPRP